MKLLKTLEEKFIPRETDPLEVMLEKTRFLERGIWLFKGIIIGAALVGFMSFVLV